MKDKAILAGVTLDRDVHGDPRYDALAYLAGYANRYEALGRMANLWARCTALQTDQPGEKTIAISLGRQGLEALVEADLGERLEDGTIRVKGCKGRHEWFVEEVATAVKGGRARADGAPRKGGRFVKQPHPNAPGGDDAPPFDPDESEPADDQPAPADHQPAGGYDQPAGEHDQPAGERHQPTTSRNQPKIKDQIKDQDQGKTKNEPVCVVPAPARARPHTGRGTPLSDGWNPSPSPAVTHAQLNACTIGVDVEEQLTRFRRWATQKNKHSGDWDAEWIWWLSRAHPVSPVVAVARAKLDRQAKVAEKQARDDEREVLAARDKQAVLELQQKLRANGFAFTPKPGAEPDIDEEPEAKSA